MRSFVLRPRNLFLCKNTNLWISPWTFVKSETAPWWYEYYSVPGQNWFMKKPEVENLVSDALFGTIGRGDLNIWYIVFLCRLHYTASLHSWMRYTYQSTYMYNICVYIHCTINYTIPNDNVNNSANVLQVSVNLHTNGSFLLFTCGTNTNDNKCLFLEWPKQKKTMTERSIATVGESDGDPQKLKAI